MYWAEILSLVPVASEVKIVCSEEEAGVDVVTGVPVDFAEEVINFKFSGAISSPFAFFSGPFRNWVTWYR